MDHAASVVGLPACVHRQAAGANGDLFCCGHPRVFAAGGLVTADVCASCHRRETVGVVSAQGAKHGTRFTPTAMQIPAGRRIVYRCDVVIPYYENLQWVPQAIDSILWQQSVEVFIHLVNDCSPEDDVWLRRKYARQQNIFWYRNRKNLGPYRSVHQVWPFMKTDYFAVQDSDDLSYPHRLWFSIHALETRGAEIFGGVMEQFLEPSALGDGAQHDQFAQRYPYWHSGQKWPSGCPHGILINGSVVMRRRLFERMNGYHNLPCGGDVEFCTRIHYAGVRRVVSSAVVGARRVNNGSLSRSGKYAMRQPARNEIHARLDRLYEEYEKPGFQANRYGCLDGTDASLTERLADGDLVEVSNG